MSDDDYGGMSLFELFAQETDAQAVLLADGLLALERIPDDPAVLESCMRAAHSLKGAARIVGVDHGVSVAHVMEECFVLAQHGSIRLDANDIDVLLSAVDVLRTIAAAGETSSTPPPGMSAVVSGLEAICARPAQSQAPQAGLEGLEGLDKALNVTMDARDASILAPQPARVATPPSPRPDVTPAAEGQAGRTSSESPLVDNSSADSPSLDSPAADRSLRVAAENLDRLLALSGQAVVEARTLRPFAESVLSVLHRQRDAILSLQRLRTRLIDEHLGETIHGALEDAIRGLEDTAEQLTERLASLEAFDRRHLALSNQLYESALASRMRPFGDITGNYPRMVREVARSLGKQVRLSVIGETTQVDRDILGLLDAPLGHLLRNAVDHGIESASERLAAGKDAEGRIRIEARQVAGTLVIEISDDGGGVDIEAVRAAVVRRNLVKPELAGGLSEGELLEFLMLPGFSMREQVTVVSGRGVGLDVVQTTVRQVRGSMRIMQQVGQGTTFRLQLPLTLSVMRCLLADIGGEPYAFPLGHINRALRVAAEEVRTVEGRPHFTYQDRSVALVLGSQVFRVAPPRATAEALSVVVFGSADEVYGLVVDGFRDERMLVVQPLDPRLGKVSDISAASLMEDGSPVLIVDVEDLMRSMGRLASAARVEVVAKVRPDATKARRKRVLVVDDSLTVRELQRKLLTHGGYDVSVAVDGMEGWNALMAERFDLVLTDVDMPRIDGIELVKMIRRDPEFRNLPVMIVSYKDRPEDRQRGLDAGADHYLAKSSFHDAALLDAVRDLIGAIEK